MATAAAPVPSKAPSRLRRWLVRVAWTLGALVGAVALAVVVVLTTDWGRGTLRDFSLRALNEQIRGKVSIERIVQLSGNRIVIEGIELFDPSGVAVARVRRLEVDPELRALFGSKIHFAYVVVDDPWVDARTTDDPDRGLIAAVALRNPSPVDEETAGPDVRVDRFRLARGNVKIEWPNDIAPPPSQSTAAGSVPPDGNVSDISLHGSLHLIPDEPFPDVRLVDLRARVEAPGQDGAEDFAEIDECDLHLHAHGKPSHARCRAHIAHASFDVDAGMTLPDDDRWDTAPVRGRLRADHLGPELLRALGQAELANDLRGPVDVRAKLDGTLGKLRSNWRIRTPGGKLVGTTSVDDGRQIAAQISTRHLSLSRVWRDTPEEALSFDADARATLSETTGTDVHLSVKEATFDETPLPALELAARILGDRFTNVDLHAEGYGGHLHAWGEGSTNGTGQVTLDVELPSTKRLGKDLRLAGVVAQADGALALHAEAKLTPKELHASGKVDVHRATFPGASCEALNADFELHGAPTAPTVAVKLVARELRVPRSWVTPPGFAVKPEPLRIVLLTADVRGGPTRYTLESRIAMPTDELALHAQLTRTEQSLVVNASADGRLDGTAWKLDVDELRQSGSSVSVKSALLAVGEQSVKVSGLYSPELVNADAEVNVDLGVTSTLLGLVPSLEGKLALNATIDGPPTRPRVGARVTGERVAVRGKPRHDFNLSLLLDGPAGSGEAAVEATSKAGLAFDVEAHATFPKRGALGPALEALEHDTKLRLTRLDTDYVQRWVPLTTLPVEGSVTGRASVHGSLTAPVLDSQWDAEVSPLGTKTPLRARSDVRYDAGAVDVSLDVSDADGEWVSLDAALIRPSKTLAEFIANASRLIVDAEWKLDAAWKRRVLGKVAYAQFLPEAARDLATRGDVKLQHTPGQEPQGEVTAHVEIPYESKSRDCRAGGRTLTLHAELEEGKLHATIQDKKLSALRFETNAALTVLPLLDGSGAARFADLGYRLRLGKVDLRDVPVLCEQLSGGISASGEGRDLLGDEPKLDLNLSLHGVSGGDLEGLDGSVAFDVNHRRAKLDASLTNLGHASRILADVPIHFGNGKLTVEDERGFRADIKLSHFPATVIAPKSGPISGVRGYIDGIVTGRGSLAAPRIQGQLEFDDIGFTATELAQPIRHVNGRLSFDNDQIRIQHVTAKDQGGTLTLNGRLDIRSLERLGLVLDVTADDFPLRREGRIVADVNLAAHIVGNSSAKRSDIEVTLSDMDVWIRDANLRRGIDLEPHSDIIDPRAPQEVPPKKGPREELTAERAPPPGAAKSDAKALASTPRKPTPPSEVRLRIRTTKAFWIKRDDFAVKLSTELEVEAKQAEVIVRGPIHIERGYLELLGETFDFDPKSSITFPGSHPPDPILALRARAKNSRSGKLIEVAITGLATAPQLAFFVEGAEVTAGEAALALFGGDDASGLDGVGNQAQSFVSGVVASLLAVTARRELGSAAPILKIEPGSELGGGKVRAGFELDDLIPESIAPFIRGIYIEGIVANDNAGSTSSSSSSSTGTGSNSGGGVNAGVLLELYFPNSFVGSGSYGPGQTWSLDVAWEP